MSMEAKKSVYNKKKINVYDSGIENNKLMDAKDEIDNKQRQKAMYKVSESNVDEVNQYEMELIISEKEKYVYV